MGTAPPDPLILGDLTQAVMRLDQMSTEVPSAPLERPPGRGLGRADARDLGSRQQQSEAFRDLVPVATRPIFGAEPRDLSLLFVLFYIAASGDEQHPGTFERNFNTRNGAQMWRFVGGAQCWR